VTAEAHTHCNLPSAVAEQHHTHQSAAHLPCSSSPPHLHRLAPASVAQKVSRGTSHYSSAQAVRIGWPCMRSPCALQAFCRSTVPRSRALSAGQEGCRACSSSHHTSLQASVSAYLCPRTALVSAVLGVWCLAADAAIDQLAWRTG